MTEDISGFVLLNKPSGITSFQAVNTIRKRLGIKKAGHTGTLDKFARGLLIILLGKYTRLAPFFTKLDKRYRAVIVFGQETDTLDPEGKIVKTGRIPGYETIMNLTIKFTGVMEQVPPVYSAVHINGVRAYKAALKGENPILSSRKVRISEISLITYKDAELKIDITCSKGTYIRSLARDMGAEASSCAYVRALKRIGIGDFKIEDAVTLEEFTENSIIVQPVRFLTKLSGIGLVNIEDEIRIKKILNGVVPDKSFFNKKDLQSSILALIGKQGEILAMVKNLGDHYRYISVFN
ncbi:MAG: tRNA pseudouridine(55) synthase TruB [Spirochaetes bacterium]|nr:tRNA pseudouridine(55) synthase TruB [Spirochaetota bacterium]